VCDNKISVLGTCVAITVMLAGGQALAHGGHHHQAAHANSHASAHNSARSYASAGSSRGSRHFHGARMRYASFHQHAGTRYAYGSAHVIQCVAFAKEDAGIQISGNARDWWGRAAGIYERGARPEEGSVLSFRANGRMPLGHVAVVSGVEDNRTILIDQSHWISGGITRDMEVKDVSQNNDWSQVRVQLSHGGAYGSIYPTHGFIYPRPDHGGSAVNEAADEEPAVAVTTRVHATRASLEVAEAPVSRGRPLDLTLGGLSFDSPSRGLR
jgi:surface antigen